MEKKNILVLGGLSEDKLTDLKDFCNITIGPVGHRMHDDYEWLVDHIVDYDALIVAKMPIDRKIMDQAKNLKIISSYGAGYDHIDVDYAREKGIVVTNCPKSVIRPTAELALALILACARRLHYYDHSMREGAFLNVDEYDNQGFSIYEKTLGIYGMGKIGIQLAQFAKSLGMKIIYHNRQRADSEIEQKLDAKYVDFKNLLTQSDFISINAPLTDDTYHKFDQAAFDLMKNNAFLINTARGKIIDQDALMNALMNDKIAGAGLDVFEDEPKIDEKLASLNNVVLTPHAGTATHKARTNLAKEACHNIISYFVDGKVINQVN